MNFRDRWVTDEHGRSFIFTVEMQRALSMAGLPVEPAALSRLDSPPRMEDDDASRQPRRDEPRAQPAPSSEETKSVVPRSQEMAAPMTIQIDPQTGKYIGRVKWYNVRKGYGFIIRGGGEEIFFHKSGAAGDPMTLAEGQWVLYDVEETRKGPEATDVEAYEGELPELDNPDQD